MNVFTIKDWDNNIVVACCNIAQCHCCLFFLILTHKKSYDHSLLNWCWYAFDASRIPCTVSKLSTSLNSVSAYQ